MIGWKSVQLHSLGRIRDPLPAGCSSVYLIAQKIFRRSIILPAMALYLYAAGSAPFLGQWDSFDYLKQIVSHRLSPLGFGRPVYLGYNILLWESTKRILHLEPLKVEGVVMMGTILLGVLGVLLFRKLAGCFLSPPASRMATLAFAISPIYAAYSGSIMTEVPMLVALMSSALFLLKPNCRRPATSVALGGIFFGMAAGIREQALTMGAAFLWILCSRRETGKRVHSILLFGGATAAVVLLPVFLFYFLDPAGFVGRTGIWLHAIPMGQVQFWKNIQASLLYTVAICPAAWLAAGAAGLHIFFKGRPWAFLKKGDGEFSPPRDGGSKSGTWDFLRCRIADCCSLARCRYTNSPSICTRCFAGFRYFLCGHL